MGFGYACLGSTLQGPAYYQLCDSEGPSISLCLSFSFYKMGTTMVVFLIDPV